MSKGRLRPKAEVYTPNTLDKTRFNNDKVIEQYDSLISKQIAEANAWRLVGLLCLIMLLISLGFLIYTINLPKTELVVIGVNDIGETKYYGASGGISYDGYDMKNSIISNILTNFIEKRYKITTDGNLMYNNYRDCMYYLEEKKRRVFELEINNSDPFALVGMLKQEVKIETIIPVSESTYQVDWINISQELSGYGYTEEKFRGVFTMMKMNAEQYNNLDEKVRVKNPMGIYITDYSIVKVEK